MVSRLWFMGKFKLSDAVCKAGSAAGKPERNAVAFHLWASIAFPFKTSTLPRMKTKSRKLLTPAEKQAQALAILRSRPAAVRRPWEEQFAWAKDDPIYDEAMKLGAEYRRSQRE
jgi:hypothetical protein